MMHHKKKKPPWKLMSLYLVQATDIVAVMHRLQTVNDEDKP